MIRYLILFSLLTLIYSPINAFCVSPWDDFLREPDTNALVGLEKSVLANAQSCDWGNPNNRNVVPMEKQRLKLLDLVRQGNESAFRAALMIMKCWDGGDLEDFYRCGGLFFEKRPYDFLTIAKEKMISDSDLKYFLIMLPLHTVDKSAVRISMLEKRIILLKKINGKSLNELKRKGLFFLEGEKEKIVSPGGGSPGRP